MLPGNLFLVVALSISLTAPAQDTASFEEPRRLYEDTVSYFIRKLMKHSDDTVIRFIVDYSYHDSLPQLGKIEFATVQYILHRSGGRAWAYKFIDHRSLRTWEFAMSAPLPFHDEDFFTWLHCQISLIQTEEIAPFVTRIITPKKLPIYERFSASHQSYCRIQWITRQKEIEKWIKEDDLLQEYRNKLPNLNYEYNTHTKLYQLFKRLEQHGKTLDWQFVFPVIKSINH
jgi:hypothetical protein